MFLPALGWGHVLDLERQVPFLPVCFGCFGTTNSVETSIEKYEASKYFTQYLTNSVSAL